MKYLKILIFSMLIVGLTVGFAMAGPVRVNNGGVNGIVRLSLEAMGTNRAIVITGTGGGNVLVWGANNTAAFYTPTQALVAGNLVKLQFSGAAFAGVPVFACSNATANATFLGQVAAVAGSTDENIQLQVGVGIGQSIFFTTGAVDPVLAGGGCNTATNNLLQVRINSTTSAITPTVTIGAYTPD